MVETAALEKKARSVEPIDEEILAMRRILRTLKKLDPEARARVVQWASSKAFSDVRGPALIGRAVESNGAAQHA